MDDIHKFSEGIATLCWVFGIGGIVLFVIISIIWKCMKADGDKDYKQPQTIANYIKIIPCILLPIAFCFQLIHIFMPTTKQMAINYVVPKIVNSESVQQIPKRLLDLTNDWLEELKPENIVKDQNSEDK